LEHQPLIRGIHQACAANSRCALRGSQDFVQGQVVLNQALRTEPNLVLLYFSPENRDVGDTRNSQ